MIDEHLLSLLACPESRQPLRLAEASLVETTNQQISQGAVKNKKGEVIKQPLEGALIREDNSVVYPIREGIPDLLIEEGIVISQ
jgi:uncharacterized protein YbaR (Trm112 family)